MLDCLFPLLLTAVPSLAPLLGSSWKNIVLGSRWTNSSTLSEGCQVKDSMQYHPHVLILEATTSSHRLDGRQPNTPDTYLFRI